MKDKLFNALKQAYSSLGLGDGILQEHASALAALGFVTDDNINIVIESQKSFLENLQKSTDKRVTDAIAKAKADRDKLDEEAKAKKAEEEKKAAEEKARLEELKKKAEDEYRTSIDTKLADMMAKFDAQANSLKALQDENNALKTANEKKARLDKILAKAKELNIPQSRIDEGFVIADDADDTAINTYLGKVASNIKAQSLPQGGGGHLNLNGEPSKEEIDNLAASLIK